MNRILLSLLVVLGSPLAVSSNRANDNVPAGRQDTPLLLTGATIHPVSGEPIPSGKLLVVDGKIGAIGGRAAKIDLPGNTRTIELEGGHLYPGLIAANSVLGLTEINAVRATSDMVEPGDINPNARALVSINPDSELIPVARANGVLASLTIPRTGGLIAGTSALMRMEGWTWEEMTIEAPVGMHVFWPKLRTSSSWTTPTDEKEIEKLRKDYEKDVEKLARAFDDARAYAKAIAESGSGVETDLRWEAMIPVFEGELSIFIHADTVAQIRAALHFCDTQGIGKPVIVGGADAWRVIDELKAANASVILGPVNGLPIRRWEAYDTPYVTASRLHEAGIPFCIANSGNSFDAPNERNLPYQAARAVAFGLPRDIALKSVTLYPARILGVSEQLGSLETGKEATFFLSDGDPLEVMSRVERAWVQGSEIDLTSKHTRLYQKYQEKYRQQAGE